jgi:histidyl-tRNA synthetase
MFRYERPQKGRYRQFHQIGAELIGVPQPQADVEVIALGRRILHELGIGGRVELELNTLGDPESRTAYRQALVSYLSAHLAELSEESRSRLERNPLRILDSKDESDRRIVADAPRFHDFLNAASQAFFAEVEAGLERLEIGYRINQRLVRGLDYYTHTVFEFVTTDLGAQGTVLAGGRYDGLVELMGGPPMPGIGWAAGIERLAMLITEPPPPRQIALVPIGEAAEALALKLAEDLRAQGLAVDLGYSGNLGRRMRRADRIGARAAILLGEDEIAAGIATLRDFDSGAQDPVPLGELAARLKALMG